MPDLGKRGGRRTIRGVSYRTVSGLAAAVLMVVFIAMNRDDTEVSFVLFTARTALWVALGVAAAGGFLAGILLGRRRYRSQALRTEQRTDRTTGERPVARSR